MTIPALPIDEQNELFARLEERIDANIEQVMEAGTHEQGVENIPADSLQIASREVLQTHERTGAATELVEIVRRVRCGSSCDDAGNSVKSPQYWGCPEALGRFTLQA